MQSSGVPAKRISSSILENVPLKGNYFLLSLKASHIANTSRPGQFLMVKPDRRYHPLLPRPFSIHRILPDIGLQVLYRRVGLGTDILSKMLPGQSLDILGPLGNGFSIPENLETALIVAGGIGIAPFPALAETIRKSHPGSKLLLFAGTKSAEELLCLDLFAKLGSEIYSATEDGSAGEKALISQVLAKYLSRGGGNQTALAYACGPNAMLKAVSELAVRYGLPLQISLESHMACGIGSCLGCPVKVRMGDGLSGLSGLSGLFGLSGSFGSSGLSGLSGSSGLSGGSGLSGCSGESEGAEGYWIYQRVCYEGPVFDANRVIWDD